MASSKAPLHSLTILELATIMAALSEGKGHQCGLHPFSDGHTRKNTKRIQFHGIP